MRSGESTPRARKKPSASVENEDPKPRDKPKVLFSEGLGVCSTRFFIRGILLVLLTGAVLLILLPSPIEPKAFQYSRKEFPEFSGSLAVNNYLKKAKRLFEEEIVGPEAFAVDHNGRVYTGLADGRIIRFNKDLSSFTTVARTGQPPYDSCGTEQAEDHCGRPLGMEFHYSQTNLLYIADSSIGLMRINIDTGEQKILLRAGMSVEGNQITFLNDLIILNNGTIIISESSYKHKRTENRYEVLESSNSGRLLYYDLFNDAFGVLLGGLHFSNGIVLSHDKQRVLIVETTRARIFQYHLVGSEAGKLDIFADNLPGLPDNISPSSSNGYWVGFAVVRTPALDFLSTRVFLRRIMSKWLFLLKVVEMVLPKHSLILELDTSGAIVRSLHDRGGDKTLATSHVLDLGDNYFLIGSYFAPFLLELQL